MQLENSILHIVMHCRYGVSWEVAGRSKTISSVLSALQEQIFILFSVHKINGASHHARRYPILACLTTAIINSPFSSTLNVGWLA